MRGYPDASLFHAIIAAVGLMLMLVFRPEGAALVSIMAVAIGGSFLVVGTMRSGLQAISETPAMFAASGADTFTLAGAASVGCACGTGDVRSVAAVMMLAIVLSIFRPLQNYSGPALSFGNVDAVGPAPAGVELFAANDDLPGPHGAGTQDGQGADRTDAGGR